MKTSLRLLIPLAMTAGLLAQTPPDAASFAVGLKARTDAVQAVKERKDTAEGAIAKLKTHASPSGLKLDRDADFAFAAIDVGQRLIADGDPEAAEKFFREAEKSFDKVIRKTADSAARDKAAFLQKLAFIRSRFLNKAAEAKADLDAALALQPEDPHLLAARDRLRAEHGHLFRSSTPAG